MDLLYPYIPKRVQLTKALRSYDVIHKDMLDLKIELNCDFLRKIGENSKFRYKSSEYQNFTGVFFLLIQKGNGNSNMFCKFQHHSMQIFFTKWRIYVFLKLKRLHQPPHSPSDFDGLPYPRVRWYPQFFS